MIKIFDELFKYLFNFEGYLKDLLENKTKIEVLGMIGLIFTFFSTLFMLSSRLDVGIITSIAVLLLNMIYTIFIIGLLLVIGKRNQVPSYNVFWFFFSVGLIDILVILSYPLTLVIGFLKPLILFTTFVLKVYYLIVGNSKIFNISKGTSFIALLSPYVVILIFFILIITSSYITLSGIINDIESILKF